MRKKWAFMAFVCGVLAAGCHSRQPEPVDVVDESVHELDEADVDSLLAEADTLRMDAELADEPIPQSVDESFDDFAFLFDQSNRLQRQRIRFPLHMTDASGEEHDVERRQWSHRSLFLGQDYCTVLWNTRAQMEGFEEDNLQEARVQHIYLHSRQVESYDFERDSLSGQWMLAGQHTSAFEESGLQDFLDFYRQFSTDSIYQRRHIQSPLRFTMAEENSEGGPVEGTIDVDQWFEFAPDMPQDVLVHIDYGQRYPNPNRMVMQMRGLGNSMQNLFHFGRDGSGRWRLTGYEN